MNSLNQNGQVLSGTVKFDQVLSSIKKNDKELQKADDFD